MGSSSPCCNCEFCPTRILHACSAGMPYSNNKHLNLTNQTECKEIQGSVTRQWIEPLAGIASMLMLASSLFLSSSSPMPTSFPTAGLCYFCCGLVLRCGWRPCYCWRPCSCICTCCGCSLYGFWRGFCCWRLFFWRISSVATVPSFVGVHAIAGVVILAFLLLLAYWLMLASLMLLTSLLASYSCCLTDYWCWRPCCCWCFRRLCSDCRLLCCKGCMDGAGLRSIYGTRNRRAKVWWQLPLFKFISFFSGVLHIY